MISFNKGNNFSDLNSNIKIFIKHVETIDVCYISMAIKWEYMKNTSVGTEQNIANELKLSLEDYRNILKDNFNGFQYKSFPCIFFKKWKDAENALDYLQSKLLMDTLAN